MAVFTVSIFQGGGGSVNVGDGTLLANLSVSAGRGPKGDGFTGGSFNASTGVVTFTSNDGLGFATGDLRSNLSEPSPIGDVNPNTGAFTSLSTTGNTTIGGNLTVNGTTTTVNSQTLDVADKNITIAFGSVDAAAANGAGLTVDGADATLTYVSAGDKWVFNKPVDVTGNIALTGTVDGRDVAADGSKLDGIEAGATADQTAAEIKTAYESNAETNAFTDAEQSKLAGIQEGAEVNSVDSVNSQTGVVVLDADDINDAATTNKFTTASDISKLAGIEAGADVTDTANVTSAGALMDSEVTNLAAVKAFDPTDHATAAQGGLADTSIQPNDSPTFVDITVSGDVTVPSINGGPLAGFRNAIINGNFAFNQRGVSGTVTLAAGAYGHDRWKAGGSGCTYTFATSANVTTLTITAGSLVQVIEGASLFTGTYVLSFTGTAQGKIGSGAFSASGVTGSVTGGTNLSIEFNTGTVAQVQLEAGSVATPFERRPVGTELALCQRYFEKTYDQSLAPGSVSENGSVCTAPDAAGNFKNFGHIGFLVPMRVAPAVTAFNPVTGLTTNQVRNFSDGTDHPLATNRVGATGFNAFVSNSSIFPFELIGFHFTADAEL